MVFTLAFLSFLLSLLLERTFLPFFFGITLPLSFWTAAAGMLFLERVKILWFSLFAGLAAYVVNGAFSTEAFLVFVSSGFIFFTAARFLEREGSIREILILAVGVFSFQLLQLIVGFFLDLKTMAAFYRASWPDVFLWNAVFVIGVWLCILAFRSWKQNRLVNYV
ncbi:MAG: hypothetical protein HYW90_04340 [Candidatus Sungbacteria bacterium]|nr:hypothetical protein [Candidatus Sungbacteria bacterium]